MKAVEDGNLGGSASVCNIVLCVTLQLDDLTGELTKGHVCFPLGSEISGNEN